MEENKNICEDIEVRRIRDEIAGLDSKPPKVTKLELPNICMCDAQDEVIVIPVSEFKRLVKCEATVDLMAKLLEMHGKYDSTRGEIIEVACRLLQKEGSNDAE